jgi:hypothetical protein
MTAVSNGNESCWAYLCLRPAARRREGGRFKNVFFLDEVLRLFVCANIYIFVVVGFGVV